MSVQTTTLPKKPVIGMTFAITVLLYTGWTLAWLLFLYINANSTLLSAPFSRFLYWTTMRALLWVLLPTLLLRRLGIKLRDVLSLRRLKTTLLYGGGTGLLLGLIPILSRIISGRPPFSIEWDWTLFTMAVIAPVVEEFFFRGAVLKALHTRLSFAAANLITGLLFLAAHFPGWYFQGRLEHMLLLPIGGALGVLCLGWVFGYIAHKTWSVPAAILTHVLNNFFNA